MDTPDRTQRNHGRATEPAIAPVVQAADAGAVALARLEPRALAPRDIPPPRVWAEACGALVTVCGVGAVEIFALDMPKWVGAAFVAVACGIAADRIRIARRPAPAEGEPTATPAAAPLDRELPAANGLNGHAERLDRELPAANGLNGHAERLDRELPAASAPNGRAERLARHLEAAASAYHAADEAAKGRANGHARSNGTPVGPAVGYTCVPALPDGSPLAADVDQITRWCENAGIEVTKIVHDVDGVSAKGGGPALQWALGQLATGEAGTLVVARLRNLSPTVAGMAPLLAWFADPARRLVAIDDAIDTGTEPGRLAATALASIGDGENARLSERTRRGLEAARSKGKGRAGAAVADVPELRERILRMRAEGMTLQAIADTFNEEGVPTLRGGAKWRPSSVHTATGYRRPAPARGVRPPGEKLDA